MPTSIPAPDHLSHRKQLSPREQPASGTETKSVPDMGFVLLAVLLISVFLGAGGRATLLVSTALAEPPPAAIITAADLAQAFPDQPERVRRILTHDLVCRDAIVFAQLFREGGSLSDADFRRRSLGQMRRIRRTTQSDDLAINWKLEIVNHKVDVAQNLMEIEARLICDGLDDRIVILVHASNRQCNYARIDLPRELLQEAGSLASSAITVSGFFTSSPVKFQSSARDGLELDYHLCLTEIQSGHPVPPLPRW